MKKLLELTGNMESRVHGLVMLPEQGQGGRTPLGLVSCDAF